MKNDVRQLLDTRLILKANGFMIIQPLIKKKLVYTATGNGQYLKIVGILAEQGIPYTAKNNSIFRSSGFLVDGYYPSTRDSFSICIGTSKLLVVFLIAILFLLILYFGFGVIRNAHFSPPQEFGEIVPPDANLYEGSLIVEKAGGSKHEGVRRSNDINKTLEDPQLLQGFKAQQDFIK